MTKPDFERRNRLFELIITGVVGLLCICIGVLIWKNHRISLVHFCPSTKMTDEDKKAYAKQIGTGLIVIGAGCVFTGVFDCVMKASGGWIGLGFALFYGISIIVKARKKYRS